jgi:FixJ family two-component response regulator
MSDGSSAQSTNVHVIDDDDSFRNSMVRLLSVAGFAAVGYRCAGEFLLAQGAHATGCILLDICMPGPSGIDLLQALVKRDSSPPIIFVTGSDDVSTTVDVMKAGAVDYVVKPVEAEEIVAKIRVALRIDASRRNALHELNQLRTRFDGLTQTERAIFHGVLHDRLNKQLAFDLGRCERTVKAQRARMLEKLDIHSIPELVKVATLLESAGVRSAEPSLLHARGP